MCRFADAIYTPHGDGYAWSSNFLSADADAIYTPHGDGYGNRGGFGSFFVDAIYIPHGDGYTQRAAATVESLPMQFTPLTGTVTFKIVVVFFTHFLDAIYTLHGDGYESSMTPFL